MKTMTFQVIKEQVENTKIVHFVASPSNIKVQTNGMFEFVDVDGNIHKDMYFSDEGIGTFNWLLAGNKIDTEKYDLSDFSYKSFTTLNRLWNADTKNAWTVVNRILRLCNLLEISKLHFHAVDREIRGVTRKYNTDIQSIDILNAIETNNLKHRLVYYHMNDTAQRFYLSADSNTWLVISNGYTGHEKLTYRVLTKFSDKESGYSFEKKRSSNKHLSKLEMTFQNLTSTLEEVVKVNLEKYLSKLSVAQFLLDFEASIGDNDRDILDILVGVSKTGLDFTDDDDEMTVLSLIGMAGFYASSNRKKGKFSSVMNSFLNTASEKYLI